MKNHDSSIGRVSRLVFAATLIVLIGLAFPASIFAEAVSPPLGPDQLFCEKDDDCVTKRCGARQGRGGPCVSKEFAGSSERDDFCITEDCKRNCVSCRCVDQRCHTENACSDGLKDCCC